MVNNLDQLLLRRRVEHMMSPWHRTDGPGMTIGVVLGRELVVHESAGMASIELGVPIGPADDISHRLGQQAVHLRCDPAACGGRQAVDRRRCATPYPGAARPWRSHHARAPDAQHLRHPRHAGDHASRRRRSRSALQAAGSDGWRVPATRAEFRARLPLSLQQLQLHAARPHRGARQRQSLREFLDRRIFTPLGMNATRHVERPTEVVHGSGDRLLPRVWWRLDAGAARLPAARRRRTGLVRHGPCAVAREFRLAAGRWHGPGRMRSPR